jgi:peroxiredoxin-like protein
MLQGGRNNVGNVQGDILSENISIPASLGGVGIGTNPDEMLVSFSESMSP